VKEERNIFRLQCEPRSSISREDHRTRLIEYDDRMRQEERKYSRLLMELNRSSRIDQSSPQRSGELNGFAKFTVDHAMEEEKSSDIQATRLTGDEILHGGDLTMDQVILKKKKPLVFHAGGCLNKTSTQHAMAFQSTLTPQERNDVHSARIEMIQSASQDACESSGRKSLPWESVKVEFAGLVLQGWRGVNSFSSSTLCGRDKDDINVSSL
jgi:hypothetical protein